MSLLIGIYFTTDEKSNKEWIRGKLKSQFLRASGMMHSVCKKRHSGAAAQKNWKNEKKGNNCKTTKNPQHRFAKHKLEV